MGAVKILDSIEILWDGEITIAVNKPAGIATQAPAGVESLESKLVSQLADRSDYLAFPHRLDRPVSGVVLVALRKRAARLLSEQFAARKVIKEYRAIVSGRFEGESRWCDHLTKVPGQAKASVVDRAHADSKRAETAVELIRYDAELDQSWLRLIPKTGRMHQLRLQAAERGHPIVGDPLYGGRPRDDGAIMLIAHALTFHDPRNGKQTTVTGSDRFEQSV